MLPVSNLHSSGCGSIKVYVGIKPAHERGSVDSSLKTRFQRRMHVSASTADSHQGGQGSPHIGACLRGRRTARRWALWSKLSRATCFSVTNFVTTRNGSYEVVRRAQGLEIHVPSIAVSISTTSALAVCLMVACKYAPSSLWQMTPKQPLEGMWAARFGGNANLDRPLPFAHSL